MESTAEPAAVRLDTTSRALTPQGRGQQMSVAEALKQGTRVRGFVLAKRDSTPQVIGPASAGKPGPTFSERKAALDRAEKEKERVARVSARRAKRAIEESQARNRRDIAVVYTDGVVVLGASTESLLALAVLCLALTTLIVGARF